MRPGVLRFGSAASLGIGARERLCRLVCILKLRGQPGFLSAVVMQTEQIARRWPYHCDGRAIKQSKAVWCPQSKRVCLRKCVACVAVGVVGGTEGILSNLDSSATICSIQLSN